MSDVLPPGWYEDPWHGPGLRWWDGGQWTTHTVVPEGAPAPPQPRVAARPPPPVPSGGPPWWVWTLAALGLGGPIATIIVLVAIAASGPWEETPQTSTVSSPSSPAFPAPTTTPSTPYRAPHSRQVGPVAPGQSARIATHDGRVRVDVEGVIDPVARGGYYRGPHSGTRWVGVRLRIQNLDTTEYRDDVGNDVRLVAGGKLLRSDSALPGTCDLFPAEISLAAGQAKAGCVLFEVPRGDRPQQLRFASESYFGPELGLFTLGR